MFQCCNSYLKPVIYISFIAINFEYAPTLISIQTVLSMLPDCEDSSAEDGLIIEFESPELEDMLLQDEEDLTCLRFRSTPLQGDDCMLIEEGEHVLATHKPQSKRHFYDAKVEKVHFLSL
jgi:hypothetical protein